MALRTLKSPVRTMTGVTDTYTFENVHGKVKQVAIKPSGVSTDFKISYVVNDITHYIMGSAGAAVSVAAVGQVFYPVEVRCLADGVDLVTAANIHAEIPVNAHDIVVAVSNGAVTETWSVEIVVEE